MPKSRKKTNCYVDPINYTVTTYNSRKTFPQPVTLNHLFRPDEQCNVPSQVVQLHRLAITKMKIVKMVSYEHDKKLRKNLSV